MNTAFDVRLGSNTTEGNARFAGYRMTFANGVTISVQFGTFNYANGLSSETNPEFTIQAATEAEVGIFSPDGGWLILDSGSYNLPLIPWTSWEQGDQVLGRLTPNEVAKLVHLAANYHAK